jgi:FlaA1/EpsC-like NDP-sugar epimerase
MFEDILTAEEGTLATKHQRIYVAKTPTDPKGRQKNLWSILDQLQVLANKDDRRAIVKTLCEMVPNFTPPESTFPSDGILQQQ